MRAIRPQKSSNPEPSELWRLVTGFWKELVYVGLFSFFVNLLMLVPPLYMLQIYDRVLSSRSTSTLLMLTLIVAFLFLTMGLLEFVRARIMNRIGARVEMRLAERVYDAMFKAGLANPAQTHGQAVEDLKQIRAFISGRALVSMIDLPWVPIYLAVLFLFHWLYGVFGTFAALVIITLAIINELSTKRPLDDSGSSATQARNLAAMQTRNAEVVQAMGMMRPLQERWQQVYHRYLVSQGQASDRSSIWMTMSRDLRILSQSLMLGLGGYLAINLEVSAGMVIAGSIILGRALAPVDQLIASWKQFATARSAYKRLDGLLARFPRQDEPMALPAPQGRLQVAGLALVPPGSQVPVVRGVGFELQPGDALGVVGPSGAGKSSLARGLLDVWPAAAGTVRLDGAELSQWSRGALAAHVGYLPQDVELFAGTVAENIARFQEVDAEAVVEAARLADVHELILRLPDGYDTQIGTGGSALSGGQRQRIGLARAIYKGPRLIVLDEPNANLDEQGEAALMGTLATLKQRGATVILITHRPAILMRMDKLLVLRDGTVARFGAREEVLPLLLPAPRQAAPSQSQDSGNTLKDPRQTGGPTLGTARS